MQSARDGPFSTSIVRVTRSTLDDLAERLLVLQPDVVRASISISCGWIPISIDHGLRRLAGLLADCGPDSLDELEAGDGRALVDRSSSASSQQSEVLPPARLVFAPMVVEHVGEQPPRLLLVVSFRRAPRECRRAVARERVDLAARDRQRPPAQRRRSASVAELRPACNKLARECARASRCRRSVEMQSSRL